MDLESVLLLVVIFSCCCSSVLPNQNSVTVGKSITGNQKLVSADQSFALGFFTPSNSTYTYLGIWYNKIPQQTVVWVANRESPIPQTSSPVFTIGHDGNLVIFDEKVKLIWSSNVLSLTSNSTEGTLLDGGNFVLRANGESKSLWESFQHPTDTLIRQMKFGFNRISGLRSKISSWTSNEDPRPGNFSFGIEPTERRFYIWNQNGIYYRFDDSCNVYIATVWCFSVINDNNQNVYLNLAYYRIWLRLRVVLNPSGQFQVMVWNQTGSNEWNVDYQAPKFECELYGHCGPFGSCGIKSDGLCRCLTGFEPKFSTDWENGKWNGGCLRKMALGCDGRDRFIKHENMKWPDHAISLGNMSVKECESQCIKNCSCSAYACQKNACFIWLRDLMDLADGITNGRDIYVRVVTDAQSGNSARRHKVLIAKIVSAIFAMLLLISTSAFIFKRKRLKRQGESRDF